MNLKAIALSTLLILASIAGTATFMKSSIAAQDPALDQQKIMEAYMKASIPGEHHANLQGLVGKWTVDVTSHMGGQVEKQTMSAEFTSLLGGRYVMQKSNGAFGGMPFEGIGIMGYDNVAGEYFSFWFDSFGTGFLSATGKAEKDAKSLEMKAVMKDAMTPEGRPWRSVQTFANENEWTFVMYDSMPGAEGFTEYKSMEMIYRRDGAPKAER